MKATIEWKDGDLWRQVNVELKCSRIGNQYFLHNGGLYVVNNLKEGSGVVTKTKEGSWTPAGRVTRNVIFLGPGLSYSETNEKMFLDQKWEKPVFA